MAQQSSLAQTNESTSSIQDGSLTNDTTGRESTLSGV